MKAAEVLKKLKSWKDKEKLEGMEKFGINTEKAYGISVYELRKLVKTVKKDHALALNLWKSGVHEARILASIIDEPEKVSQKQMEIWARDFDSWDICDSCCCNLFYKTPLAYEKALEWSFRKEEFVKRAGFVLMAALSVHDKKAPDSVFLRFLHAIKREAHDSRNFVKKAVNWALRQIGKRSSELNKAAIETAREIKKQDSKTSRWISSNALRELESKKISKRLGKKQSRVSANCSGGEEAGKQP